MFVSLDNLLSQEDERCGDRAAVREKQEQAHCYRVRHTPRGEHTTEE